MTKTKLITCAVLSAAMVAYLAYLGAASSYQYYVLVDECVDDASVLQGKRVRVSGSIVPNTLAIDDDRKGAQFVLKGETKELPVRCECLLPDNLAEGKHVVVEGKLKGVDVLEGDKVLTQCASKYESK